MSFTAAQLARFATRTAAHRVGVYAGTTEADGANLLRGTDRFTGGWIRHEQSRTIMEEGYQYLADAVAHVPEATGLTFALGERITHLPTGEVFRVDAQRTVPGSGTIRLVLGLLQ